MLLYFLKCKEKINSKNSRVVKTKNKKIMFLSICGVCGSIKSIFIKEQEASGLFHCFKMLKYTLPRTVYNWLKWQIKISVALIIGFT